jgi:molybdate transport system substrate-binding protein
VSVRVAGGLLLALVLTACAASGTAAPSPAAPTSPGTVTGTVTVFAAASLTDAFEAMGERFEDTYPDVDVAFNFASSSTLATQLTQGAPADVFASADRAQMDVVAAAGSVAGGRVDLARNSLQIAVEPGNPLAIDGLDDLARGDVTLVLAAEEVPAGEYAREALDAQAIDVAPASLETDVRAVLSRVALGEADAGVVYASDIAPADGAVDGVAIPPDQNVTASYPVARLTDAPNPAAAAAFVAYATSDEGRRLLRDAGFATP